MLPVCADSTWAKTVTCEGGSLIQKEEDKGADLEVIGECTVSEGETYYYGNVNVWGGGSLVFEDPAPGKEIHFWARSILVETDSSLIIGTPDLPIGDTCQAARDNGESVYCGRLITIHLYGKAQNTFPFGTNPGMGGQGITCKSDNMCGVPVDIWTSNGGKKVKLRGGVDDYFYAYTPLPYDDGGDPKGYFGYKVLGVSYGGTLQLTGRKGSTDDRDRDPRPSYSGTSWVRLNKTLNPGDTKLYLDRKVDPDWEAGDQIVVTTTDYLPGHSEQLEICKVERASAEDPVTVLTVQTPGTDNNVLKCGEDKNAVKYIHNGEPYDLSKKKHPGIENLNLDIKTSRKLSPGGEPAVPPTPAAETRAAVALLTRSICIKSEGNDSNTPFPDPTVKDSQGKSYYFGGHTVIRQGVERCQVQGVEFFQMGQGGRMGHYPVHFHTARKMPKDTYVKDCSIHDSMTRWITLHATQGVKLYRNVGYKSIGHGYYLEDGTEINNELYSNIGILARAAIANAQNPREVPGILAGGNPAGSNFPYNSDFSQPAVFWIMNGWNDFQYNMAAGAGACGVCYWLVPGANSGWSKDKKWESYASMQKGVGRAGTTPLKLFRGNYCTTAQWSFSTVGATDPCNGLQQLSPVNNDLVPPIDNQMYYPITLVGGGGRFPTRCDGDTADCSTVEKCSSDKKDDCMVTVLDRYTTSFHWTELNFAAIWLRPQWYLVVNSVVSDVQNAGLSFVTGGDYTASNFIPGQWMLARKNVFIGNTQKNEANPYATNAGPFNKAAWEMYGFQCDNTASQFVDRCYSKAEGISMPLPNFGNFQHLFSIYDGPAYQETNAYLDITTTPITDCPPLDLNAPSAICQNSKWMYGRVVGMRRDLTSKECYLPNAAIGWKQPNGFYYPPAFHSSNLFFDNVDIRHFVIEPMFEPGTFKTTKDRVALNKRYCTWNDAIFNNFTGIDRQTELNDDDGSLTGLVKTISVNEDSFFDAPVETIECESDETAKTSPYDYVTTVVYPDCAKGGSPNSCLADPEQPWDSDCANQKCYGVPLIRQYLNMEEATGVAQEIRMAGMNFYQRSNLTVNNGVYYIDTNAGTRKQAEGVCENKKSTWIDVPVDCTDPVNIGKTIGDFKNHAPNDAVKKEKACDCNLNVFRGGQEYYVFFLYAKPETRQTYQVYVGDALDLPDFDPKRDVKMVRANIGGTNQLTFKSEAFPEGWGRDYDSGSGILTVTVDMSVEGIKEHFTSVKLKKDLCQPRSFCSWDDEEKTCECNEALNDRNSPLYNPELYQDCIEKPGIEGRTVCSWAGNDIDCPDGRCFGFSFKLPDLFFADGGDQRPEPVPFQEDKGWCIDWDKAGADLAGTCRYDGPPPPLLNNPTYCTND